MGRIDIVKSVVKALRRLINERSLSNKDSQKSNKSSEPLDSEHKKDIH